MQLVDNRVLPTSNDPTPGCEVLVQPLVVGQPPKGRPGQDKMRGALGT